jgi:hypothetical protein
LIKSNSVCVLGIPYTSLKRVCSTSYEERLVTQTPSILNANQLDDASLFDEDIGSHERMHRMALGFSPDFSNVERRKKNENDCRH